MPDGVYVFGGHGTCRSCGDAILWWRTPAGKNLPVNDCKAVLPDGPLLEKGEKWSREEGRVLLENTHFSTCPNASKHRRR